MDDNKFIITTTIFKEDTDNPETACEVEIETDTLDDKPSLNDILAYAKNFQCSGELCINVTVDDINGDYIDHDEFFVVVGSNYESITLLEDIQEE